MAEQAPTHDLRGRIPEGGFYRFQRPANQGGEWLIAGAIKVLHLLYEHITNHEAGIEIYTKRACDRHSGEE